MTVKYPVLVFLFLALNIFHTFFYCFYSYFEQVMLARIDLDLDLLRGRYIYE